MGRASTGLGRRAIWLAWGAIGGVVVLNLGWFLAGTLQTGGYSVASDDISDLGALTAQHPWVMLVASGIGGALTILFALFALRPALAVPGRGTALGAWLLAGSLMGLDNLSDAFFRLDCRAADPGCSAAAAWSSWHGTVHIVVGVATAIAMIAAPFVLAPRMRRLAGWRDLARPTFLFGLLFLTVAIGYAALEGKTGGGYLQRTAIVLVSVGVATLALRVRALARTPGVADQDAVIGLPSPLATP
ncbi:MAG: DUF998 domain-containing protein [Actinomycetota bacterium]|nr:DUF998 domain-containing protein [Actinomycetota bacterium]